LQHAICYTPYHVGGPFFLQIPSVNNWWNTSVLFQPLGFLNHELMFFVRIYTSSNGVGKIRFDNETINAVQYQQISQTDFYYYEIMTSNDTHRITLLDPTVTYSVRRLYLFNAKAILLQVVSYTYGKNTGSGFPIANALPGIAIFTNVVKLM